MGVAVAGERRALLVSRGWVQATLLVVLCGFFILGLLAYRTYMAQPPVPQRVVDSQDRVVYTGRDIQKGQQVFLHNGLMEYGSAFGHGAYLGPDYTADYLRRSSDLVKRSYGGAASDSAGTQDDRGLAHQPLRRDTKTLTLTPAQAEAFRRLVPHYSRFFSDPTTEHGLRPKAITDPVRAPPADRVLRVDGVGRVDESPGAQLLLHEQLAARDARRQQADRQRRRLVGAVVDRAAGRDRPAVRRLRSLGAQPGLARPRTGHAHLPLARRRGADTGAAGDARGSSS